MNTLILGSGGREHVFAWKISQSEKSEKLYIAPGNAGTKLLGENIDLNISNFDEVANFISQNKIDMLVVGPEVPLVEGVVDYFLENKKFENLKIIGPDKKGAMLEGSKEFAKEFMTKNNIPTAKFISVTKNNFDEGIKFIQNTKSPYVLKADGLAAGKGVLIIDNEQEAIDELNLMINGKFGNASQKVVIEEFLSGIELSVFVVSDGKNYKILPTAKDYKRIGENDTGLNTGGMGAVSPVWFADKAFMSKVEDRIIRPTMSGFQKEGIVYKGFIFIGLMNVNDEPYVIEYNVRMGDPETEAVIPLIKSDLLDLFCGVADGNINERKIEISDQFCTTVMLVSAGYPENYEKNKIISGLEETKDCIVFHAGTKNDGKNILTNGGRVISITAFGQNIEEALDKCYKNAQIIDFEGKTYRKDIGKDLLK